MRSVEKAARADGFYRFLAFMGLSFILAAGGLTAWSLHRSQEQIFQLEAEAAAASAEIALKQDEVSRIQAHLNLVSGRLAARTDLGSAQHTLIRDEVEKSTGRLRDGELVLGGLTARAVTQSAQIATLNGQRVVSLRVGGIALGAGLLFTFAGLLLWFWRVQRYVEIETQARMTTHLVEEIVARSRSEAILHRAATSPLADDAITETTAVITETMLKPAAPPRVLNVA